VNPPRSGATTRRAPRTQDSNLRPPGHEAEQFLLKEDAKGQIRRHSDHGLTETRAADVDLATDGVVTQRLTRRVAGGAAANAAGERPPIAHQDAAPRSPVEWMVLRSMVLASAQQRQLLSVSASATHHGHCQRYANLGLRAAREVARAATVWSTLRKPPAVTLGPGAQANVVGGSQNIDQGPGPPPDESPD